MSRPSKLTFLFLLVTLNDNFHYQSQVVDTDNIT